MINLVSNHLSLSIVMPVTPFHIGPGMLIKSALHEKFSLTVFGFSQVLMDIQPLSAMLGADIELHGISHTYVGATVIGVVSCFFGKPCCQRFLSWWNKNLSAPPDSLLRTSESISWPIAITSAFIGTYSHIFLDSFMHADLTPYYPFAIKNRLIDLISMELLHIVCAATGILGLLIYFGRLLFNRKRQH